MSTIFRGNHKIEVREVEHVGFGLRDHKGREFGAIVYRGAASPRDPQIAAPEGSAFVPQATRGGVPFGASFQPARVYATDAERDAGVAGYLTEARKRALRATRGVAQS